MISASGGRDNYFYFLVLAVWMIGLCDYCCHDVYAESNRGTKNNNHVFYPLYKDRTDVY